MKASLKFREEKNPLLRAKLPFNAGVFQLSSGVAVGNSKELAIHVGTFFPAGPAIKLAFKPNDQSPLSVVLKAGLGLWGSPNGAPITLKAEFYISPKSGDPVFALRVKPRVGDFSFQKDVNGLKFAHAQSKATEETLVPLQLSAATEKLAISTPPPANGDVKGLTKRNSGNFIDKDRTRSPSIDSNAVVIGSNFSLKIEGLDREWKGRNDKKVKTEGAKEQDSEGDFMAIGNCNNVLHAPNDVSNEQLNCDGNGRSSTAISLAGVHRGLQGCRIVAHSSLPFGKQARFNVRWGVKPPLDILHSWEGSLSSLPLSKLPSLLLDKVSFEQVSIPVEKPNAAALQNGYLEGGFLPVSFIEENRELAQVASLCYNMKRQLHLLYAENQVLRRSMEDMKSQVEFRGFRSTTNGSEDGVFMKDQGFSRALSNLDSPRAFYNGREEGRWEVEARKGHKDMQRKDVDTDVRPTPSPGANADMSKELEKAIKSGKTVPSGGKRD